MFYLVSVVDIFFQGILLYRYTIIINLLSCCWVHEVFTVFDIKNKAATNTLAFQVYVFAGLPRQPRWLKQQKIRVLTIWSLGSARSKCQ